MKPLSAAKIAEIRAAGGLARVRMTATITIHTKPPDERERKVEPRKDVRLGSTLDAFEKRNREATAEEFTRAFIEAWGLEVDYEVTIDDVTQLEITPSTAQRRAA